MSDKIGSRIKQKRAEQKITQTELEKRSGVNQSRISDIETDSAKAITLEESDKIAKALGVSIDWLYNGDEFAKPITPLQWFLFTRELINNPPQYAGFGRFTTVRFDDRSLIFCGEDMEKFFAAYNALSDCGLDKETLDGMIADLFNRFSLFFTPGAVINQEGGASNGERKGQEK